jgi:hypothetical protein
MTGFSHTNAADATCVAFTFVNHMNTQRVKRYEIGL